MKKVFSFIHKRLLAFVLAVTITVTGFSALGLEADAASYAKLGMILTGSKVDIPALGISDHDLWYLTCGGNHVFCLTPGGGTHTNDSYRVTKTNPMTYSFNGSTKKGKEIARAMTYWGSEMSYSITNHKAMQSYLCCRSSRARTVRPVSARQPDGAVQRQRTLSIRSRQRISTGRFMFTLSQAVSGVRPTGTRP
ncbi:MAG: hypothetical protein V8R80_06295 [Eubacterium sp.]